VSASDRILEACCPESPIDTFEQAARVTEIVSTAHLRAFKRPRFIEEELSPVEADVELTEAEEACTLAPREETRA
jgi:hypothetical protein